MNHVTSDRLWSGPCFPSAFLKAFRGRKVYPQNVNDTTG
jgi:hypothetical protein